MSFPLRRKLFKAVVDRPVAGETPHLPVPEVEVAQRRTLRKTSAEHYVYCIPFTILQYVQSFQAATAIPTPVDVDAVIGPYHLVPLAGCRCVRDGQLSPAIGLLSSEGMIYGRHGDPGACAMPLEVGTWEREKVRKGLHTFKIKDFH